MIFGWMDGVVSVEGENRISMSAHDIEIICIVASSSLINFLAKDES